MAEKIVLSDASPLIGLAAAGGFDLLRELFGAVTVTATVRREVSAGKGLPGAGELGAAIRAGWIRVMKDLPGKTPFPWLDAGEASTLFTAMKLGASCLVLMDEVAGREQARALGLAVTGTAGVLLAARQRGLIPEVRPYFEKLMKTDFRISAEVIRTVLDDAGES
jgi:predicted nucleic acid-binding protein